LLHSTYLASPVDPIYASETIVIERSEYVPPPNYKQAAMKFLRLVASGKVREAYRKHIASDFRHHNPFFRGDAGLLVRACNHTLGSPSCCLSLEPLTKRQDSSKRQQNR
jgi:hypothetical protein